MTSTVRLSGRKGETPLRGVLGSAARLAFAAVLAMAVAGCASPPVVHFHTLLPNARPAQREGAPAPLRGPSVLLETVRVPAQADQQQWLIRLPDESMALLEQERWSAPLRDEVQQALLEVLMYRFGVVDARALGGNGPVWRVRVDVTRFESSLGEARIEGTWAIAPRSGEATLRCSLAVREAAVGAGMEGIAQAHRRALARLAEALGEQLVALQRGEPGRCSA